MSAQTLVELLHARSDSRHHVRVVDGQGGQRTLAYAELAAQAGARLAALQADGARPGDALILLIEDRLAFVIGFWAATLGGLVPVPVSGGISEEHRAKLFRIAARLDDPWLLTDAATQSRLESFIAARPDTVPAEVVQRLTARTRLLDDTVAGASQATLHRPDPDDVALIQFSSGSTSAPKGIVLTHRNLMVNMRGILEGMGMRDDDSMLSWMPLTHDMGLIGFHLTPIVADIDHALMATDVFVRRPMLWLEAASSLQASVLCSPNFGYEHLLKSFKPERMDGVDLSCVRLVFNGAEPISAALVERFNTTLAPFGLPATAMCPVYGLAEASLAVAFSRPNAPLSVRHLSRAALGIGERVEADPDGAAFVGTGTAIPYVELRLAAQDGESVSSGRVGRVMIRGDNVTSGYLGDDGLAGARDASSIDADGWLDTGDLAVQLDGQLFITGRAKDLLFLNGQNLYPHDLEGVLIGAGLVEPGRIAIAAAPGEQPGRDRAVAFVQYRGDPAEFVSRRDALRRELAMQAGISLDEVVPVPRIPKTTSGKVQRFALVRALLDGEFDTARDALPPITDIVPDDDAAASGGEADAAPSERDALEQQLLAMCQARIEDRRVARDDNLFDLGISSLTLAEIHADIERTWPDVLDITDLFDYPSVAEIAGVLRHRAATGP